ncbi:MAG: ASCH domain-containing protein [Acidobacteria bacterium]|nr:ASCH domain-containing protein [Acidobacteriota bacterium]
MKALSVKQPWAELIARGEKTIEIRDKGTKYRGPLLIVSCKEPNVWAIGCAIAMVDLVDCRLMVKADEGAALGEHQQGAKAWVLENPRRVEHVPVTGRLGVYDVDLDPGQLGI